MTEKDYNPEQKNKKTMEKQSKASGKTEVAKTPVKKEEKKVEEKKTETKNEKKEVKKTEVKKPAQKKPTVKKEFAETNSRGLPISTLDAKFICKFIKNKKIDKAIEDLEMVIRKKKSGFYERGDST